MDWAFDFAGSLFVPEGSVRSWTSEIASPTCASPRVVFSFLSGAARRGLRFQGRFGGHPSQSLRGGSLSLVYPVCFFQPRCEYVYPCMKLVFQTRSVHCTSLVGGYWDLLPLRTEGAHVFPGKSWRRLEVFSAWSAGGEHQQPVLRLPIHKLEHARS